MAVKPFDLTVFNAQTYTAMTETIDQQINVFNEASGGAIILSNKPFAGDFSIETAFKMIEQLVRRRNVYDDSAIDHKRLAQMLGVAVKVAAGTYPIDWTPAEYTWTMQNPELAALTIGEQLAKAKIADMLNAAITALVAAMKGNSKIVMDKSAENINFRTMNRAAGLFGDRQAAITTWLMHSTTRTDLVDNALANSENLFNYQQVNVWRDPQGRLFIVTDSPSLYEEKTVGEETDLQYYSLGLTPGAAAVWDQNDFDAVLEKKTGFNNLKATYQAEWSYGVNLKGYAWNEAEGGGSPSDAAIATPANWKKTMTSHKDTAGVLLISK